MPPPLSLTYFFNTNLLVAYKQQIRPNLQIIRLFIRFFDKILTKGQKSLENRQFDHDLKDVFVDFSEKI